MAYSEEQLTNILKDFQYQLRALQGRPFRIPVVNADLAPEDLTNLWMLSDGRIRFRDVAQNKIREYRETISATFPPTYAADPGVASGINLWMDSATGNMKVRLESGTVVNFAPTVAGTSTTTAAPPTVSATPVAAAYVPTSRVYDGDAIWTTCYRNGGASVNTYSAPHLNYGRLSAQNGEQMSMIGLDAATIRAQTVGGNITRVAFRISNHWTYYNNGGVLRLGTHNQGSSPGTFSEVNFNAFSMNVGKPSYDIWADIPIWIGEGLRDGSLSGITLHQGTADIAFYGYAAGVGDSASPPRIHIEYTK